jgi:hypothetical protein
MKEEKAEGGKRKAESAVAVCLLPSAFRLPLSAFRFYSSLILS